ncbi:MAG: hypothetical protein KAX62_04430 [Xylophilus sp.]|nr:hypothetical protein [Burkholderiaceae bacterium]MBP6651892.1 hypothetical protein [Xylophilus sp.]MBP8150872.1 hypothetical protein [Xylophilus sp.]MBP8229481.1 hypothetical protein [Xylophilus sp.]
MFFFLSSCIAKRPHAHAGIRCDSDSGKDWLQIMADFAPKALIGQRLLGGVRAHLAKYCENSDIFLKHDVRKQGCSTRTAIGRTG